VVGTVSLSGVYAASAADHLGVSRPIKTRAIAPTGTIGIIAETTTGIEPYLRLRISDVILREQRGISNML